MSRAFHHNTNISIGDNHFYKMESNNSGEFQMITDNGFNFVKPIRTHTFLLDNFRIIKEGDKLTIQKENSGSYRTLFSIE